MVTNGSAGIDVVDGARDHFFAGAGFAQQQRRPAAVAEFLDQVQHLAGPGRLAHEYVSGFVHIGKYFRIGVLRLVR